jgi:hypothetical protein
MAVISTALQWRSLSSSRPGYISQLSSALPQSVSASLHLPFLTTLGYPSNPAGLLRWFLMPTFSWRSSFITKPRTTTSPSGWLHLYPPPLYFNHRLLLGYLLKPRRFTAVDFIANLQLAVILHHQTWNHHVTIWGSIVTHIHFTSLPFLTGVISLNHAGLPRWFSSPTSSWRSSSSTGRGSTTSPSGAPS